MTTTPQYDNLVSEIPEGLAASIMTVLSEALRKSPGSNVKREDLVYFCFGVRVEPSRLSSSREDRQIRETIESLQMGGYRIVSQSGKPGYRLAVNDEDIESYIAELESRRVNLENKIRALRTPRPKYEYKQPVPVLVQSSML